MPHLVEKRTAQSNYKDIAEFLRLGLQAEVCSVSAVVRWADSVINAEHTPAFAFIELSLCGSLPSDTVVSLLSEVPGQPTPEFPPRMLLGYCSLLVRVGAHSATKVLLRLLLTAILERFPDSMTNALSSYEDELSLAQDQVCGTPAEVTERFSSFLVGFESYAHAIPAGIV